MLTSIAGLLNWMRSFLKAGLNWFSLVALIVASASVLANDGYFLSQGTLTINAIFLMVGVLLAVLPRITNQNGIAGLIILLPLCAGMSQQIDAFFGVSILVLPNAGLDLVVGYFIGYFGQLLIKKQLSLRDLTLPWPIGLLLLIITLSTTLAIIRNIRQSATETSFFGLLFNLMHFRPIGWHDDYMPIADWIAYGIAGALIVTVLSLLRVVENPSRLIFRSLIAGLFIAFLMGLLQSVTGLGLPTSLHDFRRDSLGFAAIGFQPDIHAFAGHMLLGVVGLWAYFMACREKWERTILFAVIGCSWMGLLISKSRASLLIAILATITILLVYIWQAHRKQFYIICLGIFGILAALIALLILNSNSLIGYPIFSWLVEPIQLIQNKDLFSLSVLGGASGSRFEIWSAALNMIQAFPLMGVGQGNFYHLSADVAFSKSHFLALNNGENAHNYFLQTFAELGLVGMIACVLVFAYPFANIQNRKLLLPAGLGILALFLGNIYSHSFLVRENLLLCAALLGLMYFISSTHESIKLHSLAFINKHWAWKNLSIIALFVLVLASAHEVYRSFYTKIFEIGVNCFKVRPLTEDGWTSGVYEVIVSGHTQGISFNAFRPERLPSKQHVNIRVDLLSFAGEGILSTSFPLLDGALSSKSISWPTGSIENFEGGRVRIRVENCFVPRDIGFNEDSRRLGIKISDFVIFSDSR
jgi:hypothetical protein